MSTPLASPATLQVTPVSAGGGDLGLVLTGGGARGAYQVGVLSWLAERFPELHVPIITGVSAGAVNAGYLASRLGSFQQGVQELAELWRQLTTDHVFRAGPGSLGWTALRWGLRLVSGGHVTAPQVQALLDTTPLRELIEEVFGAVEGRLMGIDYNIHRGALRAVGIVTTSYTTGESVIWVQGRDVEPWERPMRRCVTTRLGVEHIMASTALPVFFPAIRVDQEWHGDGGMRLAAPLSPALRLGASRLLAISTRSDRYPNQRSLPAIHGYPPPAQVFGVLLNAIFLDVIDQDAGRLERINRLLEHVPPEHRESMRHVKLLVVRPSRDLGRLVRAYEPRLPVAFRFMTRGLGTRETRSPDALSMLMFQSDYISRLIEIGYADAEARADELVAFLEGGPEMPVEASAG